VKRNSAYPFLFVGVLFLGVIGVFSACTTKKNTRVTRTYHNITSRYNGYFYARESMKDAADKIDKTYKDDYSTLLPLFPLPNTPETKSTFADYEKAIKKSTSVIERHAITSKGIEVPGAVKWIDDSYLIIGQAHYYKGEFLAALEIFTYMTQKYVKFPSRFDGYLWQARTQVELGGYTQAETILDMIASDKNCPAKLQFDLKSAYVDIYMRTGKYENAIKQLEEAIVLSKKKLVRARYTYILAQLFELTGENKKAFKAYSDVIEMNPPYDMLINARISRAKLSGSNSKTREGAQKELEKMLSDAKNIEYKDQIYYTLGSLEQQSGNTDAAKDYYLKSIASSIDNIKQKALTYLALGDLFFTDMDYRNAQAYYDSTMQVLPKEYPDYIAIDEKRSTLNTLVRYIKTVEYEDSLQNIVRKYGADTATLYAYIDKLIADQQEAERKKKEELEQALLTGGPNLGANPGSGNGGPATGNPGALWYFYNPSTVSFGIGEFTRKWGTRRLEDNWRRSNKESYIVDNADPSSTGTGQQTASSGKNTGSKKQAREPYLKPLPLQPDDMAKSDEQIADALYNLGSIFKDQIKNLSRSSEAFESLCKRYPKHKYALPSHFQLYRIYEAEKNQPKSDEHKNYILNNYPESEYAQLIRNPQAEVNKLALRDKVNAYYAETYGLFKQGQYGEVISHCNLADSTFGKKNEQAARFAYLRAVSEGKTLGIPTMEKSLVQLIASYPKDPVKNQAQKLLDAILKQQGSTTNDSSVVSTDPAYTFIPTVEHQLMVVVQKGKGNIAQFRNALSDFNATNFASGNLTISSILLDANRELIIVTGFPDKNGAMNYYNALEPDPNVFTDLSDGYQVFVISKDNYTLFYRDKNAETYKAFFEKQLLGISN
jgi:tetratricopeptide (TPR) repeat protein